MNKISYCILHPIVITDLNKDDFVSYTMFVIIWILNLTLKLKLVLFGQPWSQPTVLYTKHKKHI